MKQVLLTLCTSVVAIIVWIFQSDNQVQVLANERLKNAVNFALHDAGMEYDHAHYEQYGEMIFDQEAAEEVFFDTLEKNLRMEADLARWKFRPTEHSLFRDDIELIWFDTVDDDDGVEFPYEYRYVNSAEGIDYRETLYGPSVVAILKVPNPKFFKTSDEFLYVKRSIYEYVPQVNYVGGVPPQSEFTWQPRPAKTGDTITLVDQSFDLDGRIVEWQWTVTDPVGVVEIYQNQYPVITDVRSGTYEVDLMVKDDDGFWSSRKTYKLNVR